MIDHPLRHGESLGTWRPPRHATFRHPGERAISSVAERGAMQASVTGHQRFNTLEIVRIDCLLELTNLVC